MSNIGTQIKAKNQKRGNAELAALTGGFDRREHIRKVERNDRMQERRANGSRYSDRTPFFDGTDHINLWDRGQTDVGKALAIDSDVNVDVRGLGKFRSFYSLWIYLTSKNRSLDMRTAPSYKLRQVVRNRRETGEFDDGALNVRYVMMVSLWDYITADKALVDALIKTDEVSIVSYVETNGMRTTHSQAKWWVPMVKLARATLIAGTDLDAEFLRDAPGSYDEIVKSFRAAGSRLGRIDRTPKAKPENKPKEKKAREPKPVKVPALAPARDRNFLGYDTDELSKDFSSDGPGGYSVAFLSDPDHRKSVLWYALGKPQAEVESMIAAGPMGTHRNPTHWLFVHYNVHGFAIRTSTWKFPNPLGVDDFAPVRGNAYDNDVFSSLSNVIGEEEAQRVLAMCQNTPDDDENVSRYLKATGDSYEWKIATKLKVNVLESEGGAPADATVIAGAILSEVPVGHTVSIDQEVELSPNADSGEAAQSAVVESELK